jgi:hypothetical protein
MDVERELEQLLGVGRDAFLSKVVNLLHPDNSTQLSDSPRLATMAIALRGLERDLALDGFYRWLDGNNGTLLAPALEGLREIGAARTLAIMRGIEMRFPSATFPTDDASRSQLMQHLAAAPGFDEFRTDDVAYRNSGEDLVELFRRYARAHLGDFARAVAEVRSHRLGVQGRTDLRTAQASGKVSSLFRAVEIEDAKAIGVLSTSGLDLDALCVDLQNPLQNGVNALHYCLLRGASLSVVRALVEHGCDVNRRSERGWTPLFYARKYRRGDEADKVMEYLVAHGARSEPAL